MGGPWFSHVVSPLGSVSVFELAAASGLLGGPDCVGVQSSFFSALTLALSAFALEALSFFAFGSF
jgi:hypothetical protein